jgi:hypothetical protein
MVIKKPVPVPKKLAEELVISEDLILNKMVSQKKG